MKQVTKKPMTDTDRQFAIDFHRSIPRKVKAIIFLYMVTWLMHGRRLVLNEMSFDTKSNSALHLPAPYNELVDELLELGFLVYLTRLSSWKFWSRKKYLVIEWR